jgi:crotonobetainyl-CoA:carnitine CoA-transferase CaiB-like acyl-CoA transferase
MKPLQGIRVLDLSRVLAGPWCTQLLADMGAEVIKVERPGAGDDTRHWGPPWHEHEDEKVAAYFLAANRGKKSAAIDFARPQGAELVRRLAEASDVLVENFKVGGLARFGLDAATLRAANPRLVYASITGFGQEGPYADRAGYDYIIQGMGGMMSITGLPDGDPGGGPMRAGVAIVDLFTGLYASNAVLAALHRRQVTGEGATIDLSLFESQQCAGQRPRPGPPGQHAPEHCTLPAVRGRRPADHHCRRQRSPVQAAGRDGRCFGMGD